MGLALAGGVIGSLIHVGRRPTATDAEQVLRSRGCWAPMTLVLRSAWRGWMSRSIYVKIDLSALDGMGEGGILDLLEPIEPGAMTWQCGALH
jgi:hypothetical protein